MIGGSNMVNNQNESKDSLSTEIKDLIEKECDHERDLESISVENKEVMMEISQDIMKEVEIITDETNQEYLKEEKQEIKTEPNYEIIMEEDLLKDANQDFMNEEIELMKKTSEDSIYEFDKPMGSSRLSNPMLAKELSKYLCENVMVVLKANQLNILNQVFRPIMVGKLAEVCAEYALFEQVNIKMNQAPEFIFPTPLMIPLNQIAWYMPFDPAVRISLY